MGGHTNTPASAAYAAFESVRFLLWFYPPQAAVTLMGCCGLSGYITNQHRLQEPLLSCTSLPGASTWHLYFRAKSVNRPEHNPKIALNPHRLWTLLLLRHGPASWFTPLEEVSGTCQFAYTIASKVDAMDCPQTGLPLQSFENSYGYLYLSPGG